MTTFKQVEANRRNASKSTGPVTETGKDRSRRNAVRHGLTAETVIGTLEDVEDYKRFEAAVTADFNPETAVERELVLRLASLLWRLRRATSIETGMFQNSTKIPVNGEPTVEPACEMYADTGADVGPSAPHANGHMPVMHRGDPDCAGTLGEDMDTLCHLANRFLYLAAVDKGAFERLGRYETALWRQVCQTVFMLDVLRRQNSDVKWLPRSSHPGSSNPFSHSVLPRR